MASASQSPNAWTDPTWLQEQALAREDVARALDASLILVIRSSRRLSAAARKQRVVTASQAKAFHEKKQARDDEVRIALRYRLLLLRIQLHTAAFDEAIVNLHAMRDAYEAMTQIVIQIERAGVKESSSREAITRVPDGLIASLHALAVGVDEFREFSAGGGRAKKDVTSRLSKTLSNALWAHRDIICVGGGSTSQQITTTKA